MRITLNLATRPYADLGPALKRLRIAIAVLAVAAIGLFFGLREIHQKAEEARATEDRVQRQIDAINQERQGYMNRMHQPANAQLLAQVGTLNQLFEEKNFSWTLAMEDLETVLPGGVQVTSIDPSRDAKTGRITLKMRVVGPRDHADDLVENLERSKHFLQPHIVDESTESNSGANQHMEPVSASNRFTFEILAEYNAAAPEEVRTEEKHREQQQPAEMKQEKKKAQAAVGRPGPSTPKPLPPPIVHPILNSPTAHPAPGPLLPPGQQQIRPLGRPSPIPNPNAGGPR